MTQLALFPPPAQPEQLSIDFPPSTNPKGSPMIPIHRPPRPGLLRRLREALGLAPKWTPPRTVPDELAGADLAVVRAALQLYAREKAKEQQWPAHEAAMAVLSKLQRAR